ncbi:DUF952 domain-containing protein [soil metagenome]
MQYQRPDQSRAANVTYHLAPTAAWDARGTGAEYVPEAFDDDGFIHCTNGLEPLLEVANLFYQADERDYEVLVLDVTRITSEVRYDDPDQKFPHIYGPLNTSAVFGRLTAQRDSDGTFLGFAQGV